jgi:hypothetical protein
MTSLTSGGGVNDTADHMLGIVVYFKVNIKQKT